MFEEKGETCLRKLENPEKMNVKGSRLAKYVQLPDHWHFAIGVALASHDYRRSDVRTSQAKPYSLQERDQ